VTNFTDATPRTLAVVQPALDVLFLGTSFTSLDVNDAFQVRLGIPDGQLTAMQYEQAVRFGGTPLTATIVNTNVTAAQLVTTALTANSVQVSVAVGQARSPSTVATDGVAFDPLASGSTTVSATIPGFIALPTASVAVTISAPALTLNLTTDVGAGLQEGQSGFLNAGGHGGITVRLTSSNPSVLLLSPNPTTPGAPFIDIPLANGVQSFSYYTQGIEGTSATASVNAIADGFIDANVSVTTRQPAIDILFLNSTTTSGAPDDDFQVRTGWSSGTAMSVEQAIRAGGTALTATVTNSNGTAGQLVTTAGAGQSRTVQVLTGQARSPSTVTGGGIAFDALAVGQTTVTIQTATGYLILPTASVVVTVN
jgi:hypothetical protein